MDTASLALSIISIIISILVVYIEIKENRKNRLQDKKNELVSTLNNRIDEYSNMTTGVVFAQLTNLYQELSELLYKNYVNVENLSAMPNAEIAPEINDVFREMDIKLKANSYIFNSDLNEKLWSYKDMVESMLGSVADKQNADVSIRSQIDELSSLYDDIQEYFKTDLQRIQCNITDIINDFKSEYQKTINTKENKMFH